MLVVSDVTLPPESGGDRDGGGVGCIHGDVGGRPIEPAEDLFDQRSLARLAWSGDDDEPPGLFTQAGQKGLSVWALEGFHGSRLHY